MDLCLRAEEILQMRVAIEQREAEFNIVITFVFKLGISHA